MIEQGLLVGRQFEKPAFLDRPFDGAPCGEAFRPLPRHQFSVVVESFVADRIPAFVAPEIKVAPLSHGAPDRLAGAMVLGIRRADETVI